MFRRKLHLSTHSYWSRPLQGVRPAGRMPLLRLIPLENLGLDPGLQNQRLKHWPMKGKETYLTVLSTSSRL